MNPVLKLFADAGPILRALVRSRAGAVLIALQCALTLAILTNAVFIIQDRIGKMSRPSGVAVAEVFNLTVLPVAADPAYRSTLQRDLAAIRALPGVASVGLINSLPLSGGGRSSGYSAVPDAKPGTDVSTAVYLADEHTLPTLGLALVAGRNFKPEEIAAVPLNTDTVPTAAVISAEYARRLFPDTKDLDAVVGKPLYANDGRSTTIVGIVERLQTPWIGWGKLEHAMLVSEYITEPAALRYLVRAEPGAREQVMPEVEKLLAKLDPNRIVGELKTQTEVEREAYADYRAMATILTAVIVLIVAVTALGIVGLASFNVNARRKQIGTRRALGAQKADILRYFLVESWLISTAGCLLGAVLSVALSWWLVATFDLPPLDWKLVPAGVVVLWVLSVVAVLPPARRAAALPPALATRST